MHQSHPQRGTFPKGTHAYAYASIDPRAPRIATLGTGRVMLARRPRGAGSSPAPAPMACGHPPRIDWGRRGGRRDRHVVHGREKKKAANAGRFADRSDADAAGTAAASWLGGPSGPALPCAGGGRSGAIPPQARPPDSCLSFLSSPAPSPSIYNQGSPPHLASEEQRSARKLARTRPGTTYHAPPPPVPRGRDGHGDGEWQGDRQGQTDGRDLRRPPAQLTSDVGTHHRTHATPWQTMAHAGNADWMAQYAGFRPFGITAEPTPNGRSFAGGYFQSFTNTGPTIGVLGQVPKYSTGGSANGLVVASNAAGTPIWAVSFNSAFSVIKSIAYANGKVYVGG